MTSNPDNSFNPEKQKPSVIFRSVEQPEELDQLAGHSSSYENLKFDFSPVYLEKLKQMLQEPNTYQSIAKSEKGEFVGYVAASEKLFSDYLFLAELFVSPLSSGQGVGSGLVREVIDRAKKAGLKGVMTQTEHENLPAQALYEKLGFHKVENPNSNDVTYQLTFDQTT